MTTKVKQLDRKIFNAIYTHIYKNFAINKPHSDNIKCLLEAAALYDRRCDTELLAMLCSAIWALDTANTSLGKINEVHPACRGGDLLYTLSRAAQLLSLQSSLTYEIDNLDDISFLDNKDASNLVTLLDQ